MNGSPTEEISMHRGVRQGDPLAPFLFIIAMEALNVAMNQACRMVFLKVLHCLITARPFHICSMWMMLCSLAHGL